MVDERKVNPAQAAAAISKFGPHDSNDLRAHIIGLLRGNVSELETLTNFQAEEIERLRTALQALFDAILADNEHEPNQDGCPICVAMADAEKVLPK